jgi:hypothetical protein
MSTQHCNGKDDLGNPCCCLRLICRQDQQSDTPVLCRDCGHIEGAHPAPILTPQSIITGYRDAARLSVKTSLKASAQEAITETTSGLKRQKEVDPSEGPSKKKGKVTSLMSLHLGMSLINTFRLVGKRNCFEVS